MSRGRRGRRGGRKRVTTTPFVYRADKVTYGTPEYGHIVLMGDSILDNENYTDGAPDVSQRLHGIAGDDWAVTLVARDGATTRSFGWQYQHIPEDATHLVVSLGGNDAMGEWKLLTDKDYYTRRETLEELARIRDEFAGRYEDVILPLTEMGIPVTLCTIYDCDFLPGDVDAIKAAVTVFNDVILRFALKYHLDILDLRNVCTDPEDYELSIEPSPIGGAKIAAAIALHLNVRESVTA